MWLISRSGAEVDCVVTSLEWSLLLLVLLPALGILELGFLVGYLAAIFVIINDLVNFTKLNLTVSFRFRSIQILPRCIVVGERRRSHCSIFWLALHAEDGGVRTRLEYNGLTVLGTRRHFLINPVLPRLALPDRSVLRVR